LRIFYLLLIAVTLQAQFPGFNKFRDFLTRTEESGDVEPDITAPNTTGAFATLFILANRDSIDETSAIGSDSADVAGYKVFARSSSDEAWVEIADAASINDVSYSLFMLVSIDGNDTLFTRVAAYDEEDNIGAGITAFQAPEDSMWNLQMVDYPGTFTWMKFDLSPDDSTTDGDSLYTLSIADTFITEPDTLNISVDSLHYHYDANDSVMFVRVKFYNGSWGSWGAWFPDTLIYPDEGEPSYTFVENAEADEYDNAATAETGVVDGNYTTTILRGAQSIYLADGANTVYWTITTTDAVYFHFQFRTDDATPTANNVTFALQVGTGLRYYISHRTGGQLRVYNNTVNATGTTVLADNTTYHIWGEYVPGSGANGISRLWLGTTTTRPGSVEVEVTAGNATGDINRLYFVNAAAGDQNIIVDQVYLDDTTQFTTVPE
jgi:hypothetical protein